MNILADTGLLVALARANDQYNDWASEIGERVNWPALTCEAVLAETAFHLRSCEPVLEMLHDGVVQLAFDCKSSLAHLEDLAHRYADRKPDFADLCLIRMSELYPRHILVTVDEEDFRVYRRNKREVIPLLCPPRK